MKKVLALLLSLALTVSCTAALAETETEAAKPLDLSTFEKNSEVFSLAASEDGSSAMVVVNQTAEHRAFSTPYDHPEYYSVIFPALIVLNYPDEANRIPVLEIYISYRGTKALNISSVSFIGGVMSRRDHRFTPEVSRSAEDGTAGEEMLIALGRTAADSGLLLDLIMDGYGYTNLNYAKGEDSQGKLPDWTVILHGDEDVEISLPKSFWTELGLMTVALNEADAFERLSLLSGTPLEVTKIQ